MVRTKILAVALAVSSALMPTQALAQYMYACAGNICRVYWCDGYGPGTTCTYLYSVPRNMSED